MLLILKNFLVVLDSSGFSKGYGFIRFGNETEQQSALHSMTGTPGLGSKPIKVNKVSITAKNKMMAAMGMGHHGGGGDSYNSSMMGGDAGAGDPSATDYSQYWQSQYGQYWQQYAAWSQYSQQYYDPSQANAAYYGHSQQQAGHHSYPSQPDANGQTVSLDPQLKTALGKNSDSTKQSNDFADEAYDLEEDSLLDGDPFELVDHSAKVDTELENRKFFARTEELWDAIESSRWWQDEQ